MRRKVRLSIGCLVILALIFVFGQTGQTTAESRQNQTAGGAKFALLVGINDYDDKGISDLQGTENDVKLMTELLVDVYKFDEKTDIRTLVSAKGSKTEKPTKANITAAFRAHLIENARRFKEKNPSSDGATVLFYYSGHGSYVPDQATEKEGKDEYSDGLDETIVPMDAERTSETTDIRDDDLNAWFTELKKYTSNITFVFDSCHSGTVTRGANNKSIKGREFANAQKTQTRGGDAPLNETMDKEEGYVTISGSLPNEQSQEGEVAILPKGDAKLPDESSAPQQWNGYLTYYLVKELRENRGLPLGDLMRSVSTAVVKKNKEQTPQIEGDVERQFLGTKETRQKRSIRIQKIEKVGDETFITIEAGKIVGALPGGVIGIYKETAPVLAGETDRLAVGKIVESYNYTSKVKVSSPAITEKSKVVLATPFFTDQKRRVAVDTSGGDAGAKTLKEFKESLAKDDFFEAVEAPVKIDANRITVGGSADWNVAVARGTFAMFKEGARKSTKDAAALKDSDEVFFLATPNGNPIYNFFVRADDPNAKAEIKEALEKYTRVENFLTLDNAVSNMNGQMELRLIRLKSLKWTPENESKPCEVEEFTPAELEKIEKDSVPLSPGDWFYFEIVNKTDQQLFPYLYNVSTKGAIQLSYQPRSDSDFLPSGKSLPLFSPKSCTGISVFQAEEPFGKETFKIVATSKRFDGKVLESSEIAKGKRSVGQSALESLFDQASTNARSNQVSIPFSGWGTAKLEIEVLPKK